MRRLVWLLVLLAVGVGSLAADKRITPPPIPITPFPTTIYFAVASERPGSVYSLNIATGHVSRFYTRPSGQLFSFVNWVKEGSGKLWFVNANDNKIYVAICVHGNWDPEHVVYTHTTYVRDIAFGPEPTIGTPAPSHGLIMRLFFSEATGAGGGKIYYLDSRNRPHLFYQVNMSWAGNFAFDEEGNLYLSSGNAVGASIYKVVNGVPQKIYTDPKGAITGFVVREGKIYFSTWAGASIRVLDLSTGKVREIYHNPRMRWLSDVGFGG